MPVITAPSAPAFQTGAPFLFILPLVIAVAVLAFAGNRGVGVFKKQGVAWCLTALMIVAAIGIGYGKAANASNTPEPAPDHQVGPGAFPSYVRDDAGVLSDRTVRELDQRNLRLYGDYGVVIGVVACNYGRDDLDSYAVKRAEDMGLTGYDLIVVLDIRGDDYWLAVGDSLTEDCSDYAWRYMEDGFAAGDYDSAVLSLTQALEEWYGEYFS